MLADITVFVLYGSVVVALGWGYTGYIERVYNGASGRSRWSSAASIG
jgi:hypothetical protein